MLCFSEWVGEREREREIRKRSIRERKDKESESAREITERLKKITERDGVCREISVTLIKM